MPAISHLLLQWVIDAACVVEHGRRRGTGTWNMDVEHGRGTWTWNTDGEHGWGTWTWNVYY